MASYTRSSAMFIIAAAIVAILMVGETIAQETIPSCATNLTPCVDYLNSTSPPAACCNPLRETITTQRDCLCSLYNSPTLLPSFGINITQARELPKNCGISNGTNLCSNATAPAPAPATPTATTTPPAVPGRDDSSSAGGKMAWAGASSLLLLWVSMVAC